MAKTEEDVEAARELTVAVRRTGFGAGLRRALLRPEAASLSALVVLWSVFSVTANPLFLTKATFVSIASLAADVGIIGIGVTLLMIGGHFDLSTGAVLALSSYIGVTLVQDFGFPVWFAVVGTLIVASAVGALNGIIVVYTGLHSFVVTLATLLWARGLLYWLAGGQVYRIHLPQGFVDILAGKKFFGFRMNLLWFILLAVAGSVLLFRTRFGNWIFSSGGNRAAARDLGVPVNRVTIALFAMSAFGAGTVGAIQAARFDSVDPQRGLGIELVVIASVVIGGTFLTGGYGSVVGTVIGALVFGSIQVGLLLSKVPGFWFNTTVGVLLMIAVLLNKVLTRFILSTGGRGPAEGLGLGGGD